MVSSAPRRRLENTVSTEHEPQLTCLGQQGRPAKATAGDITTSEDPSQLQSWLVPGLLVLGQQAARSASMASALQAPKLNTLCLWGGGGVQLNTLGVY